MRVIVSRCSGFCFGVKRAVWLTKSRLKKGRKIYSLGPLIHNKWVVSELSKNGLEVIKDLRNIKGTACVILPSHGVAPEKIRKRKGLKYVDTTCPFVFKAQTLIKELAGSGYEILILGDKNHPEVKGLVGISRGKAKVIDGAGGARAYMPSSLKVALVSQTTQSLENFAAAGAMLLEKNFTELRIFNTICRDAIKRQDEAKDIARKVDVMLVIGGRESANTKRLASVCGKFTKVYHIEDERDIRKPWFYKVNKVGIITGASTPGEFIKRVRDKIKKIKGGKR